MSESMAPNNPLPPSEGTSLRVLLVEDNQTNLLLGCKMLEKMGCSVVQAANGKIALTLLANQTVDIIFMDCEMPVMNGFDATREIRSHCPELRNIPVIALTAHVTPENHRHCMESGMSDFLAKPISLASLQKILEKWMPGRTQRISERPTTRSRRTEVPSETSAIESPSPEPKAPPLSEVPLFDTTTIQSLRETGGVGLLQTLFNGFSREAPTILEEIRSALADNHLDRIRRSTHRLKGSCLSFGAKRLAEVCRTVETLTLLGDFSRIGPGIDALSPVLDQTLRDFSLFLAKNPD